MDEAMNEKRAKTAICAECSGPAWETQLENWWDAHNLGFEDTMMDEIEEEAGPFSTLVNGRFEPARFEGLRIEIDRDGEVRPFYDPGVINCGGCLHEFCKFAWEVAQDLLIAKTDRDLAILRDERAMRKVFSRPA